jgi:pimeloyl-ACP methyl ester carboxylesterase
MTEINAAHIPVGSRIRLSHHRFELPDGRRVGLSVGGRGVPLVFFHGIGMNRRVYLRLLSRLPQLGFLVVAIDAPGHGETYLPRPGERSFAARMAATEEVLDALGIERALLVGHSMGGRTAAELAARRPERALGVVLIDPALGEAFDASRERMKSPTETATALLAGAFDTIRDRVGLGRLGFVRHVRMLGERSLHTVLHPRIFLSTATAIVHSDRSAIALSLLRENSVPTVVVHGERDMVVPIESAANAANLSGATLVTLPGGYHSWVLPSPWTFVDILRQLVARGHLGHELRSEALDVRQNLTDTEASGQYVLRGAAVLDLVPEVHILGDAHPRNNLLYHPYRIWERPLDA